MGKGLDGKTVKSAQRVLEMLDYVGQSDREITVMDVVRDLTYPQSSTSELLSCLVHLGYLNYDRMRRTFRPTMRVAMIGSRDGSSLVRDGVLHETATLIRTETGAPVMIAMIHQRSVMYVHVEGMNRIATQLAPDCPVQSAFGKVLLTDWDEDAIRDIVRWRNAETGASVRSADLMAELATIRRQGYCATPASQDFYGIMVSVPLPDCSSDRLSIGITMDEDTTPSEIQSVVATLRSCISRKFGGQPVSAPKGIAHRVTMSALRQAIPV